MGRKFKYKFKVFWYLFKADLSHTWNFMKKKKKKDVEIFLFRPVHEINQ